MTVVTKHLDQNLFLSAAGFAVSFSFHIMPCIIDVDAINGRMTKLDFSVIRFLDHVYSKVGL